GHAAGDELIRTMAQRMTAMLREADIGARFGGDEFVILSTGARRPEQIIVLAERLLERVSTPVQLPYGEVAVSASIGIAFYPDDGPTVEDLLRNADTAMYRAKAEGKGAIRFFESGMDEALVVRRRI